MTPKNVPNEFVYQIKVQGRLGEGWTAWLNGMSVIIERSEPPVTTITGAVIDQARLRGIINRLWDLNLTLISVNRVE